MKRKTKITLIVISSVVAVLFVALMIYFFGATFPQFYSVSKKEFNIPGLNTDFCPQGLAYDEGSENFLVSGYMSKGGPSRIYFVKKGKNNADKYVVLKESGSNGALYAGHCGGITVYGNYGYIVGDKKLHRFSLRDALSANNGGAVEIIDTLDTGNGADFVLTYNDKLIVGEFHKDGKYNTDKSHHIKVSGNKTNKALSFVYTIDESSPYGLATEKPESAISMPSLVQGMTFTNAGNIVLSTSYGLPASNIYIYQNVLEKEPQKTVSVMGENIPLYVLDSDILIKSIKAPCMSEEMALADGRVYVLFESACKKYKLFTRTRLTNVYSMDI